MLPILAGVLLLGSATSAITIASAATDTTTGTTQSGLMGPGGPGENHTPPAAAGKVTAISGNTITIDDQRAGKTFTVDATNATVVKDRDTASTVSAIVVGDMIGVEGTVSGTTVTATEIHDGMFGGHGGRGGPGGPHGVMGTVSAINGTTLTVTDDHDGGTYTVDASAATVKASGVASTLSSVKVGDKVMIGGKVTTASMTATNIEDGLSTPPAGAPATTN